MDQPPDEQPTPSVQGAESPKAGPCCSKRDFWPALAVLLFAVAIWWLTEVRLQPPQ